MFAVYEEWTNNQAAPVLTPSVLPCAARSSPAGPGSVQGHIALNLRHRRAHVR